MPFPIRDARMTDMAALRGVFRRASLSNEGDRRQLLDHPEWLVLAEDGVREGRMRVAVSAADTVLGFATYRLADGIAELEDLFVDPPWMRRGIAEALVLDLSERLRTMGFESLEVTANPHASAFYAHLGFVGSATVETEFYPAPRMRRPLH